MLHTTKEFEKDNTILFECLFRDSNGAMYITTSPTYTILDMRDNVISTGTPEEKSTGHYYFAWTSSTIGHYTLIFSGTVSGKQVTIRKPFIIKETGLNN
jgi:hypothetical protein